MKKLTLIFVVSIWWYSLEAQVSISTNGATPDPSAILDVKSTNKGLIPPRVADTNAILNPAEGTLIYDMSSHGMRYFNGLIWSDCMGNIVPSFRCGDPLVDVRDSQTYPTVKIGTQCWMAKNLNIGTMVTLNTNQLDNGTLEKYCYGNSTPNCNVYGGMYQWNEMMQYVTTAGVKGICPTGWHLPTDAEWCTMEQTLDPSVTCVSIGERGIDVGGKVKEVGTSHWYAPNTGATNSSGFTALGGGFVAGAANWDISYIAIFWTSTENSSTKSWRRWPHYSDAKIRRDCDEPKTCGYSVRCVKDN